MLFSFVVLSLIFSASGTPGDPDKCSTYCRKENKLKYNVGSTYIYDYNVVTKTFVDNQLPDGSSPPSEDISQLFFQAEAEFHVVSPCELILQLRNASLKDGNHGKEARGRDADFRMALERNALRFHYVDGVVAGLCPAEEEPVWVVNAKRGLLTAFQQSVSKYMLLGDLSHTIYEKDVSGVCKTKYERLDLSEDVAEILKRKDLMTCGHDAQQPLLSLLPDGGAGRRRPLVESEQSCRQKVKSGRYGHLLKSTCHERHQFTPLSNDGSGLITKVQQVLELKTITQDVVLPEIESRVTRRSSLLFEKENDEDGERTAAVTEDGVYNILKEMEENSEDGVTFGVNTKFAQLIEALKLMSSAQILEVVSSVPGGSAKRKFFLDAIQLVGTADSVAAMAGAFEQGEIARDEIDGWLTSLAFQVQPTAPMISALKPLLNDGELDGKAMLGISALVHAYCRSHMCQNDSRVDAIMDRIEGYLGDGCSTRAQADQERVLVSLKAIGNSGVLRESVFDNLKRCYMNADNPMDIRLAAITALRRVDCTRQSVYGADILNVYADIKQDTELRIASYLMAMRCPSVPLIKTIRRTLYNDDVNQVASFVWTHLTNLQETSSGWKKETKDMLSNEFLQNKFNTDGRKFSRNYEGSVYSDRLGAGATVDSNIVFSPESYLPRSVSFNFTADLFGRTLNLFEIGARVEGFEETVENLFGENGVFPENARHVLDILKGKSGASENQIDLVSSAKKIISPKGSFYGRIFGNEIYFNQFEGINELFGMKKKQHASSSLLNLFKNESIDYTKSFIFLDRKYTVPTISGLPLTLAVNASATVGMKMRSDIRLENLFKTLSGSVLFKMNPSAAVEVIGAMSVDATVIRAGVRSVSRLNTNTNADVNMSVADGELLEMSFNFPKEKIELIDVSSELFAFHGEHSIRLESPPSYDRDRWDTCSGQRLPTKTGLRFCSIVQVNNASRFPEAPYFPLTGPFRYALLIEKTDIFDKYYFKVHKQQSYNRLVNMFSLQFDTPGSTVDRNFEASGALDLVNNDVRLSLVSPYGRFNASGSLLNGVQEKGLVASAYVNGVEVVSLKGGIVTSSSNQYQRFQPSFSLNVRNAPAVNVTGSVTYAPGSRYSADLQIVNAITKEPIVLGADFNLKRNGWSTMLALKSPAVSVKAKGDLWLSGAARRDPAASGKASILYSFGASRPNETIFFTAKVQQHNRAVFTKNKLYVNLQASQWPEYGTELNWDLYRGEGRVNSLVKAQIGGRQWTSQQLYLNTASKLQRQRNFEVKLSLTCPSMKINSVTQLLHKVTDESTTSRALAQLSASERLIAELFYAKESETERRVRAELSNDLHTTFVADVKLHASEESALARWKVDAAFWSHYDRVTNNAVSLYANASLSRDTGERATVNYLLHARLYSDCRGEVLNTTARFNSVSNADAHQYTNIVFSDIDFQTAFIYSWVHLGANFQFNHTKSVSENSCSVQWRLWNANDKDMQIVAELEAVNAPDMRKLTFDWRNFVQASDSMNYSLAIWDGKENVSPGDNMDDRMADRSGGIEVKWAGLGTNEKEIRLAYILLRSAIVLEAFAPECYHKLTAAVTSDADAGIHQFDTSYLWGGEKQGAKEIRLLTKLESHQHKFATEVSLLTPFSEYERSKLILNINRNGTKTVSAESNLDWKGKTSTLKLTGHADDRRLQLLGALTVELPSIAADMSVDLRASVEGIPAAYRTYLLFKWNGERSSLLTVLKTGAQKEGALHIISPHFDDFNAYFMACDQSFGLNATWAEAKVVALTSSFTGPFDYHLEVVTPFEKLNRVFLRFESDTASVNNRFSGTGLLSTSLVGYDTSGRNPNTIFVSFSNGVSDSGLWSSTFELRDNRSSTAINWRADANLDLYPYSFEAETKINCSGSYVLASRGVLSHRHEGNNDFVSSFVGFYNDHNFAFKANHRLSLESRLLDVQLVTSRGSEKARVANFTLRRTSPSPRSSSYITTVNLPFGYAMLHELKTYSGGVWSSNFDLQSPTRFLMINNMHNMEHEGNTILIVHDMMFNFDNKVSSAALNVSYLEKSFIANDMKFLFKSPWTDDVKVDYSLSGIVEQKKQMKIYVDYGPTRHIAVESVLLYSPPSKGSFSLQIDSPFSRQVVFSADYDFENNIRKLASLVRYMERAMDLKFESKIHGMNSIALLEATLSNQNVVVNSIGAKLTSTFNSVGEDEDLNIKGAFNLNDQLFDIAAGYSVVSFPSDFNITLNAVTKIGMDNDVRSIGFKLVSDLDSSDEEEKPQLRGEFHVNDHLVDVAVGYSVVDFPFNFNVTLDADATFENRNWHSITIKYESNFIADSKNESEPKVGYANCIVSYLNETVVVGRTAFSHGDNNSIHTSFSLVTSTEESWNVYGNSTIDFTAWNDFYTVVNFGNGDSIYLLESDVRLAAGAPLSAEVHLSTTDFNLIGKFGSAVSGNGSSIDSRVLFDFNRTGDSVPSISARANFHSDRLNLTDSGSFNNVTFDAITKIFDLANLECNLKYSKEKYRSDYSLTSRQSNTPFIDLFMHSEAGDGTGVYKNVTLGLLNGDGVNSGFKLEIETSRKIDDDEEGHGIVTVRVSPKSNFHFKVVSLRADYSVDPKAKAVHGKFYYRINDVLTRNLNGSLVYQNSSVVASIESIDEDFQRAQLSINSNDLMVLVERGNGSIYRLVAHVDSNGMSASTYTPASHLARYHVDVNYSALFETYSGREVSMRVFEDNTLIMSVLGTLYSDWSVKAGVELQIFVKRTIDISFKSLTTSTSLGRNFFVFFWTNGRKYSFDGDLRLKPFYVQSSIEYYTSERNSGQVTIGAEFTGRNSVCRLNVKYAGNPVIDANVRYGFNSAMNFETHLDLYSEKVFHFHFIGNNVLAVFVDLMFPLAITFPSGSKVHINIDFNFLREGAKSMKSVFSLGPVDYELNGMLSYDNSSCISVLFMRLSDGETSKELRVKSGYSQPAPENTDKATLLMMVDLNDEKYLNFELRMPTPLFAEVDILLPKPFRLVPSIMGLYGGYDFRTPSKIMSLEINGENPFFFNSNVSLSATEGVMKINFTNSLAVSEVTTYAINSKYDFKTEAEVMFEVVTSGKTVTDFKLLLDGAGEGMVIANLEGVFGFAFAYDFLDATKTTYLRVNRAADVWGFSNSFLFLNYVAVFESNITSTPNDFDLAMYSAYDLMMTDKNSGIVIDVQLNNVTIGEFKSILSWEQNGASLAMSFDSFFLMNASLACSVGKQDDGGTHYDVQLHGGTYDRNYLYNERIYVNGFLHAGIKNKWKSGLILNTECEMASLFGADYYVYSYAGAAETSSECNIKFTTLIEYDAPTSNSTFELLVDEAGRNTETARSLIYNVRGDLFTDKSYISGNISMENSKSETYRMVLTSQQNRSISEKKFHKENIAGLINIGFTKYDPVLKQNLSRTIRIERESYLDKVLWFAVVNVPEISAEDVNVRAEFRTKNGYNLTVMASVENEPLLLFNSSLNIGDGSVMGDCKIFVEKTGIEVLNYLEGTTTVSSFFSTDHKHDFFMISQKNKAQLSEKYANIFSYNFYSYSALNRSINVSLGKGYSVKLNGVLGNNSTATSSSVDGEVVYDYMPLTFNLNISTGSDYDIRMLSTDINVVSPKHRCTLKYDSKVGVNIGSKIFGVFNVTQKSGSKLLFGIDFKLINQKYQNVSGDFSVKVSANKIFSSSMNITTTKFLSEGGRVSYAVVKLSASGLGAADAPAEIVAEFTSDGLQASNGRVSVTLSKRSYDIAAHYQSGRDNLNVLMKMDFPSFKKSFKFGLSKYLNTENMEEIKLYLNEDDIRTAYKSNGKTVILTAVVNHSGKQYVSLTIEGTVSPLLECFIIYEGFGRKGRLTTATIKEHDLIRNRLELETDDVSAVVTVDLNMGYANPSIEVRYAYSDGFLQQTHTAELSFVRGNPVSVLTGRVTSPYISGVGERHATLTLSHKNYDFIQINFHEMLFFEMKRDEKSCSIMFEAGGKEHLLEYSLDKASGNGDFTATANLDSFLRVTGNCTLNGDRFGLVLGAEYDSCDGSLNTCTALKIRMHKDAEQLKVEGTLCLPSNSSTALEEISSRHEYNIILSLIDGKQLVDGKLFFSKDRSGYNFTLHHQKASPFNIELDAIGFEKTYKFSLCMNNSAFSFFAGDVYQTSDGFCSFNSHFIYGINTAFTIDLKTPFLDLIESLHINGTLNWKGKHIRRVDFNFLQTRSKFKSVKASLHFNLSELCEIDARAILSLPIKSYDNIELSVLIPSLNGKEEKGDVRGHVIVKLPNVTGYRVRLASSKEEVQEEKHYVKSFKIETLAPDYHPATWEAILSVEKSYDRTLLGDVHVTSHELRVKCLDRSFSSTTSNLLDGERNKNTRKFNIVHDGEDVLELVISNSLKFDWKFAHVSSYLRTGIKGHERYGFVLHFENDKAKKLVTQLSLPKYKDDIGLEFEYVYESLMHNKLRTSLYMPFSPRFLFSILDEVISFEINNDIDFANGNALSFFDVGRGDSSVGYYFDLQSTDSLIEVNLNSYLSPSCKVTAIFSGSTTEHGGSVLVKLSTPFDGVKETEFKAGILDFENFFFDTFVTFHVNSVMLFNTAIAVKGVDGNTFEILYPHRRFFINYSYNFDSKFYIEGKTGWEDAVATSRIAGKVFTDCKYYGNSKVAIEMALYSNSSAFLIEASRNCSKEKTEHFGMISLGDKGFGIRTLSENANNHTLSQLKNEIELQLPHEVIIGHVLLSNRSNEMSESDFNLRWGEKRNETKGMGFGVTSKSTFSKRIVIKHFALLDDIEIELISKDDRIGLTTGYSSDAAENRFKADLHWQRESKGVSGLELMTSYPALNMYNRLVFNLSSSASNLDCGVLIEYVDPDNRSRYISILGGYDADVYALVFEADGDSITMGGSVWSKEENNCSGVAYEMRVNEKEPVRIQACVDSEHPGLELELNYGRNRSYNAYAGLPHNRQLNAGISHTASGIQTKDLVSVLSLNMSRTLWGYFEYSSNIYNDFATIVLDEYYDYEYKRVIDDTASSIEEALSSFVKVQHNIYSLLDETLERSIQLYNATLDEIEAVSHFGEDFEISENRFIRCLMATYEPVMKFARENLGPLLTFLQDGANEMWCFFDEFQLSRIAAQAKDIVKSGVLSGYSLGLAIKEEVRYALYDLKMLGKGVVSEILSSYSNVINCITYARYRFLLTVYAAGGMCREIVSAANNHFQHLQVLAEGLEEITRLSRKTLSQVLYVLRTRQEYMIEGLADLSNSIAHAVSRQWTKVGNLIPGKFLIMLEDGKTTARTYTMKIYYKAIWFWEYAETTEKLTEGIKYFLIDFLKLAMKSLNDASSDMYGSFELSAGRQSFQFQQKLPFDWEGFDHWPKFEQLRDLPTVENMINDAVKLDSYRNFMNDGLEIYADGNGLLPLHLAPLSSASALIMGNHFVTFDGHTFDLNPAASSGHRYVLINSTDNALTVLINYTGTNEEAKGRTGEEWSIMVLSGVHRVDIGYPSGAVALDGRAVEFPKSTDEPLLTLRRYVDRVVLTCEHGLTVDYNLLSRVFKFTLSGRLFGKTAGLFGNYNNEIADDLRLPNGSRPVANSTNEFVRSWCVGSGCPVQAANDGVRHYSDYALKVCGSYFEAANADLSKCFRAVDPAPYTRMCLEDLTGEKGEANEGSLPCAIISAYQTRCRSAGVDLQMPSACVQCQLSDGTTLFGGETVDLKEAYDGKGKRTAPADVVFVVERSGCLRSLGLSDLLGRLPEAAAGNRYAAVSFGEGHRRSEPQVNTVDGEVWMDSGKGLDKALRSIIRRSTDAESTNRVVGQRDSALMAIKAALALLNDPNQYERGRPVAAVAKVIVLVLCEPCAESEGYVDLTESLLESDVSMHVLQRKALGTTAGKVGQVFGIDLRGAYTGRSVASLAPSRPLLKQMAMPKDLCSTVALESNGTIFSVDRMKKKAIDIWVRRVVTTRTGDAMCRRCECAQADTGTATLKCHRCAYPQLLRRVVQDQELFDWDNFFAGNGGAHLNVSGSVSSIEEASISL